MEMSRLTRDGTAEPVSRDQILRHARGQGNIIFPVQLTTSRIGNLTRLIHTLLHVMTIHTYINTRIDPPKGGSTILVSKTSDQARQRDTLSFFFISFFFNLTYSRWTSSLPSCLWSQRIFPSLPDSRLTFFYHDASSALLQLVNQWLNLTYSRSHAFRYERKNTNPTIVRIELTTSALEGVQITY